MAGFCADVDSLFRNNDRGQDDKFIPTSQQSVYGKMNVHDIKIQLSTDLGEPVEINPIHDADFKNEVPDATRKFRVQTPSGAEFFLIVSGSGNPRLMDRAVANIRSVRANVSAEVASHILQPVAAGVDGSMSYAVWQAKKPFPLKGRLERFFAHSRYAGPVLNWSKNLTCETLKDSDLSTSIGNLQAIYNEEAFPELMRDDALKAEQRARAGTWQPKHCIQHGDFWSGNILLPTERREPSFYIIDWAGMQFNGYPFLDLARMLMSMRCRSRVCSHHIEDLRNRTKCDQLDTISYTLSGLGDIRKNLEYFPLERYQSMAIKVYNFMKRD